ncbi:MAG: MIP/aquaporin family protein, partial [Planctomycetia bacterium]|nr:MIP/aquaporin family protein [Planctomycetia bacterium]
MNQRRHFAAECFAEVLGTFILVFFGIGAVHVAVLSGMQSGIWQIATVWALGVALSVYAVGAISGAHLNPAVTIALACVAGFPFRKVVPYIISQLAGAVIAAAILYVLFSGVISTFEKQNKIVRGQAGSERSAMIYGEYFPNPDVRDARGWTDDVVSMPQAMLMEAICTAFLLLMIMALTDQKNKGNAGNYLAPLFIGLTVATCISLAAPLTQACFNPARDFGPRLVAWLAGWGNIAIPGPRGGFFTVYILAPIIGGIAGAGLYQWFIAPVYLAQDQTSQASKDET